VKVVIMLNSIGVCTAYFIVFGDTIDKMFEKTKGMDFKHNFFYPRKFNIIVFKHIVRLF